MNAPPLVRREPAAGFPGIPAGVVVVEQITAEQVWRAYKPFMDLLGVTPYDVYAEAPPTIRLTHDGLMEIDYLKVVDPEAPREDWPVVEVGEGDGRELAYHVTIEVAGSYAASSVWPDATRRRSTRAEAGV